MGCMVLEGTPLVKLQIAAEYEGKSVGKDIVEYVAEGPQSQYLRGK